jgi:polysaccharide chain length determinant protein (PEP-CTERM system associated)
MHSLYEEIRVALHNIWLRRWIMLGVAWAVALIGWLVISGIPNRYESKASVYVQMQSLLPNKIGISEGERLKAVDAIQRTLLSAANLEKVVRGTNLGREVTTPRQMQDAITDLRDNVKVVARGDNTFEISATSGASGLSNGENAQLAQAMVQKLLDLFREGNLSGGRTETSQSLRFLDSQLAQREQELRLAEAKRVEFEQKNLGVLPGVGGASISQRMQAGRTELNQIESSLMSAQGALAALNGQLASTQPSIATPGQYLPGGGAASARVAALEGQLADAQSRGWTDSHPDMIGLRNQLARARVAAANEGGPRMTGGSSTPNPMYVTLRSMQAEKQATVASLGARRAQLQAEMAQYSAKQIEEPGLAAEQARLNRDYDVLKAQYDKLLQDREDIRLRGSVQSETSATTQQVLEPPSAPRAPVAPNRPLLLTLVLFGALAAGTGVAFALSQIKTTYASAGRLERASGLPVLGAVSHINSLAEAAQSKLRLRYFRGAAAALAGAWVLLLAVEFFQRSMVA